MAVINFSGLASGIDASALIQALIDQQRKAKITPLQTRIEDLTETNSKFSELKTLLGGLQTAAGKFREVNGSALAKLATSSNEAVATATATSAATNGSYSLNVTQRARNGSQSFNDRFAAGDAVINSNINNADPAVDRTVSYTIGTGAQQETVDVELTNTTTAEQFVTQFNSQSTKAVASLVNVGTSGSPSYAISITSLNEGTEKGQIAVTVGSSISDPNGDLSTADGSFLSQSTNAAQNAQFTVSGIAGTITRSTNSVSDVIQGVTLNLQATGTVDVSVNNDPDATTSAVQDLVDAFNEVVEFVRENDVITRDESGSEVKNIFGPFASTSVDDNLLTALRQSLSNAGTSGRSVNVLADLGITTQRDGTLAFDSEKLRTAIADDAEGVRIITQTLGEDLGSITGTIAQFTRFNGIIDASLSSNLDDITNSENRISLLEKNLSQQEQSLTSRFAKLESLVARLNSQQSALTAALG